MGPRLRGALVDGQARRHTHGVELLMARPLIWRRQPRQRLFWAAENGVCARDAVVQGAQATDLVVEADAAVQVEATALKGIAGALWLDGAELVAEERVLVAALRKEAIRQRALSFHLADSSHVEVAQQRLRFRRQRKVSDTHRHGPLVSGSGRMLVDGLAEEVPQKPLLDLQTVLIFVSEQLVDEVVLLHYFFHRILLRVIRAHFDPRLRTDLLWQLQHRHTRLRNSDHNSFIVALRVSFQSLFGGDSRILAAARRKQLIFVSTQWLERADHPRRLFPCIKRSVQCR